MKLKVALLTSDSRLEITQAGSSCPIFGTAPSALLEGFAGNPHIEVHVISCVQQRMSSPTELSKNIRFHCLYVPKWGWLRAGYAGCILAVRNVLRKIRPDLVHAQGTERDCAIEAVTCGYPNLITVHGNIRSVAQKLRAHLFSYYWLQSRFESWALKRADGVLCNSRYTKAMVLPLNQVTYLVPNAVREIFFKTPRQPKKSISGGLYLLMVGTITPYKQALEFLRFLRDRRQQTSFFVEKCSWIGRADPNHLYGRQFLEELSVARSQGWAEHFQELSPSVLIQKMDESDALVHLPTEEAFGLVVAEAMIRGLPIIAAKTGGLPDFASYYQKIRLVPNQPCSEWEEALSSQFLRDARVPLDSWPSHVYKPQDVASKHLEIYREVIASR